MTDNRDRALEEAFIDPATKHWEDDAIDRLDAPATLRAVIPFLTKAERRVLLLVAADAPLIESDKRTLRRLQSKMSGFVPTTGSPMQGDNGPA